MRQVHFHPAQERAIVNHFYSPSKSGIVDCMFRKEEIIQISDFLF